MAKKLILFGALLLVATSLFAGTGEVMPWDGPLEKIQKTLSGKTAMTIGIIMFIGAGLALAFTEGQALKKIFWIVMGIAIAVNAVTFGTMIFGSSSGFLLQ